MAVATWAIQGCRQIIMTHMSSNGQAKDKAIIVEGVGKQYHIGLREDRHDTLLKSAGAWLAAPMKNFRQLRRLSARDDEEAEDEDGTEADGVAVGTSVTLVSFFPSLLSSSCLNGASGVGGVGREAGATGFCAFCSSTAAGVATGATAAFLAAAAVDVSLEVEGRGGDALEVTPPAALGTAAVRTCPEIGLGTWFLLPPLLLFFFLPFAMMAVRSVRVFLWSCGGVVWIWGACGMRMGGRCKEAGFEVGAGKLQAGKVSGPCMCACAARGE